METEIRRATVLDGEAIATIIADVFEDNVDMDYVRQLLALSHNFTYVALHSGVVVGFVDTFVTISQEKETRLELDLLAVQPNARGKGIGKRLIEHSLMLARQLQVSCIRALVASDNKVMQKTCQSVGLLPSQDEYSLYVLSPSDMWNADFMVSKSHLIGVNTLSYSGIWLEGTISRTAILNAQLVAMQRGYHVLGAVVDKAHGTTIELLADNGFIHVGDYHWWILNLRGG